MQAERKPIKVGGNLHGHQPFFVAKTQNDTVDNRFILLKSP